MNILKKINALLMNRGLNFRLILSFTLISLVPLLALGFFSYYKSSNTVQDTARKYSMDMISEISINMFLRFKNIDDISKVLLNSTEVKEILAENDPMMKESQYQDQAKMGSILKSITFSNDYITSIYILPEQNRQIFAVGDVTGNYGINYLTDEYKDTYKKSGLYQETVTEYNNYKWWPIQNILGKNVFVLTRKLYDVEKGVLGVIVIHVSERILDDIYNRINHERQSTLYLLDQNGIILYHPDKSNIGNTMGNKQIQREIVKSEKGSFITFQDNHKMFAVYNTFFVTGWKLMILTPYDEIISQAVMIRYATLTIIAMCLVFVIFLSFFMSRGILNPVHKLVQLMNKGATGDMGVRFDVQYQDEIGQLGNSFNKMMANIEQLMKMVEAEHKQKVEAEIKALEAHINPHFLYNTLASIYWTAMGEGNTKVGEMASSLSNYFRLGLNKGKEFTTVGKEVEHVKEYLRIQKMRYNHQFKFDVDVDRKVIGYSTIKLILQPLVENALVHGIEKKHGKGYIYVQVVGRDGRIVFRVMDNGLGIPTLAEEGLQKIIDNGYGLKNVQQRLKLYFNEDYTICCTSIPEKETVFEITIPAVLREEEENNV